MAECTIYDKLRYIAETKDLIKAAIEAQDVEVLESATFRQYAEYITEIRKVSSVNGMQGDVTITAEDLGALTEIPSEYITETELNEKGYLTAVPDVYITEDELSSQLADKVSQNGLNEAIDGVRNDIPTNVSQLTNDSGYITLSEVPKQDLSGYALKSEIPDISVKQDKLTAGNGISITDNVISLDYEYDLFEVVPSLPTENINDNKIYLVYQSDGEGNNLYIEYIYASGHWEELGKFKANVDLSGYATEEWVNEQGFLKEHQDISNLATKEELNAKQDVISDLATIRSGAAKGATALQTVPDTYALKSDILSAKTDERYTDYDVQNPVLSGNTIVLQNEVTDSRKYHTLGYEKTITTSVPVQKYINITRNYNGVPSMDTDIESGIDFSVDSDGVGHMYCHITFTLDKIKNATNLMHYEVSYPERDSEGNVTGCGEQVVAYVTYDPNTKLLSIPEGGFGFAQILRSDTNHYLFGGGSDGNEYLENGRWYYNFEQGPLQEGATLTWYISCNTPYQYCDYYVTINGLFYQEGSVTTDDKPERLNDYIRYANNVKAYILTDKNTTFKTINGEQITGNGNIEVAANVDLSGYATKSELNAKQDVISDLDTIRSGAALGSTALQSVPNTYALKSEIPDISTKQDTLVSGTNIKTINGNSLLGSGDITIEGGSGNVDLSDYYTKTETNELVNPKLQQVTLTQAEYDALETKQDNVLYVISDAEDLKFKTINGEQITGEGNIEVATKSELATKQDVINDLDTIRSGAALGATALQEVPDTYALKSEIPDISTKQDKLVSGTNIKTVNGTSLLGSGNIEVAKEWIGTQSEYDALPTKDNNTTYYITE